MPAWTFKGAADRAEAMLGADTSNNDQATTNVTANADGSIVERLEFLQGRTTQLASKAVTFTAAAYEINTAVAVFTVSGTVEVRCWGQVSTAIEADAGNDGTISLGVEDDVDILLPVTTVNETNFAQHDVWTDSGTQQGDAFAAADWVVVANSEPIEINVLVEDITAGAMTLYAEWRAVTAGATVTAA